MGRLWVFDRGSSSFAQSASSPTSRVCASASVLAMIRSGVRSAL
ncbi:MAG: hypothetical protein J0H02_10780 [Armatimonadetes bacterium]|nr:hypothetical protein [Armatimonadota bacterium]